MKMQIVVGLALLLSVALPARAGTIDGEYWLQIAGPYELRKVPEDDALSKDNGPFELVEFQPPTTPPADVPDRRYYSGWRRLVSRVEQYAVRNSIIVGTMKKRHFLDNCYFLLDIGREKWPEAKLFLSKSDWQTALREHGISPDIELLNPDDVARTRSERELRPMRYRFFNGVLGLSDYAWSNWIFLAGMIGCFLLGLFQHRPSVVKTCSLLLGWIIGVWLLLFVNREIDAGALLGAFIMLPLLFRFMGYLGQLVRRWRTKRTSAALPPDNANPGTRGTESA